MVVDDGRGWRGDGGAGLRDASLLRDDAGAR